VDPATDADHCGGCDRICPKSCGSGVCVPAIADFSLGSKHTCVTLGDASVYCWGHNGNGQLGQPDPTTHYTPHAVDGLAALQVAVGDFSNCALSTDGLVYCWGNSLTWPVPTALPSFGGVAQLTLGAHHTCALLMDGTVSCFGSNVHAQLGRGEPTPTDSPDPAPVWDLDGVVQVVAGSRHTCARLVGGSVKCWGDNEFLQAGSAVDSPVRKPLLVPGVSDAVHIGAGARHTCAVSKAGTLTCWGYGQDSQLGSFQLGGSEPILVDGLTGVRVVAGGDRHTCALLADETVKCWGRGYLGDGKEQWETPTPQSVVGLSGVERIEAGEGHTCALNGHGTLYCWGEGDYGQLGTGASSAALSPEPVAW
jgi:alpha-tubulin suppressor-like RCC1 family protein